MTERAAVGDRDRIAAASISCLAAVLLLANLGNQHLWQDEAQTALIAETVLSHGIPLGYDGKNHFSQELGIEYGEGYVWKWHTWLPFYLVAASFLGAGVGTFAARLPFALLGIATVVLTFRAARCFWKEPWAAAAAAGMLTLSVPFLVLCRQARWYAAAACFALMGLHAYGRIGSGSRFPSAALFAAATLLFHTHALYCASLLAALLVHAALLERSRLRSVAVVSAGVVALNLPWIVWLWSIPYGENFGDRLLDLAESLRSGSIFVERLAADLFAPPLLLIPPALAIWRLAEGRRAVAVPPETWRNVALIALFCAFTLIALALLSPGPFFRYLAPLAPPLFLLSGLLVGSLARRSLVAGIAVVLFWVASGSMRDFLYEITHDFDGPIEGIVSFLNQRGSAEDTVAISYGDLPVKFYTGMRVIGGATGEDLSELEGADWIILRKHVNRAEPYRRVRAALAAQLSPDRYSRFEIDYPDTAFENREDPRLHRFRTETDEKRVQIFGRRR